MAIMTLSLLWGSSFIAIKIIVDEVQPLASFGMRFFIAGLLLVSAHYILIHTIYRRSERKDYQIPQFKNRQLWKSWLLSALFFIVGGQGILAIGAQYLSSGVCGSNQFHNPYLGSNIHAAIPREETNQIKHSWHYGRVYRTNYFGSSNLGIGGIQLGWCHFTYYQLHFMGDRLIIF